MDAELVNETTQPEPPSRVTAMTMTHAQSKNGEESLLTRAVEERRGTMYLVLTLRVDNESIVQALRFRSKQVAEAALSGLREGTTDVVTIDSDTGDSLTIRREAIADSHLATAAPPPLERGVRANPNDLIERLGQPIYNGQNTFGFIIGQPPYTVHFSNKRDHVMVWECGGGTHRNRCMAEC
ncbi:MAG: hypothetical protein JO225_12565, partial [Candidatus Eremiobacteraeota bacterium]|nr:hypothetical protein [Candidatus Eremiobacteraeota bacterium]